MHARDGDEASCCRLLLPPGDRVVPSRRRRRPPMTRLSAAGTSPPRRSRDLYLATSLPGDVMLSRHRFASCSLFATSSMLACSRGLGHFPHARPHSSRSRRSPVGAPLPGARTPSSCRSATTPLLHRAGLCDAICPRCLFFTESL
ncbi:Os11g0559600 [Oryza sativa Japonica Group]|uniref:Expressed protein n=2 Tax=Oryza sativa subsp. japonica TaxID=39947 RepID=Q2R2K1_ORYSJ|nr:expressed protein [Oryza sativa Japonica Group]KAF2911311.1 hypothetical protein DAI22_11g167900 [Oryza sativa Japonica Group]BAF28464.1 Os11g0559600 [Oryza sativa Japonica Group]BAG89274.1 unnamed protein product [Oryza sativa Japonica Group]|eukprot:NP_001068101.1 Os11g0559600 [Oryza sativa Japonica Group]